MKGKSPAGQTSLTLTRASLSLCLQLSSFHLTLCWRIKSLLAYQTFVGGWNLCWQIKHITTNSPFTEFCIHSCFRGSKEVFFWKRGGIYKHQIVGASVGGLVTLAFCPTSPVPGPLWGVPHIKAIQILPRFNNQFPANGCYFTEKVQRVSFGDCCHVQFLLERAETINLNLFRLTF